ncbi:hypothetical protein acdb102_27560 [Acidothermaceae bacterium B102]|nr:hypothetical protein acdb102_27560 [Acidothermaceae bacterium B102]
MNRTSLSVTALLAAGLALAPMASPAAMAATTSPGAIGISITSPVVASGMKTVPVTCSTGALYKASVSKATVKGATVSVAVSIAGYKGPGSYPATVTLTVKEANGTVIPLPRQVKTPAAITSTGGSFTATYTATQGKKRTFAGSVRWTCGS